jgi:hypothetical protein
LVTIPPRPLSAGRRVFPGPVGKVGAQLQRSRSFPACAWVSDWFAATYSVVPDLGDSPSALSAPAPFPSPTLTHSQRPFARMSYYPHRHCSYSLMRQCRSHQRISRRTPLISSALRTRHLPHFDHTPMSWCRHPYAGRSPECICPSSSSGALAFARTIRTRHLHLHHIDLEHSLARALSG